MEQRQRPDDPVLGGQSGNRYVAGGDRPQAGALRGEHALGLAGRAGGVEHPGDLVEPEVVTGRDRRVDADEITERGGAPRNGVVAGDDDPEPLPAVAQADHLLGVVRVGHHDDRAAVVEQVRQFRVGAARVQRYAHRRGPGDGEPALHHLDTVVEVEGHPVPPVHAEVGQMAGQPPGAYVQLRVADRRAGVAERDLVPEAVGVCPEQTGQRLDQVAERHVTTSVRRRDPRPWRRSP
ncbi:hypothetical protein GCM10009779_05940 [Polymorphospora rubra]